MTASKIFISLPVDNIQNSKKFFSNLGFNFVMHFSDEKSICMLISETIYVMLQQKEKFLSYTKKSIADAHKNTEVLLRLDIDSRKKVDDMVSNAIKHGGTFHHEVQDFGWMYGHSFADIDGHQWELTYFDENAIHEE
jgi:uncharacterized protein